MVKKLADLFCSPQSRLQIRSPSFFHHSLIFDLNFAIPSLGCGGMWMDGYVVGGWGYVVLVGPTFVQWVVGCC